MPTSEKNTTTSTSDASNKIIWIVVAIVAALIIGAIVFFLRQSPNTDVSGAGGLANAIRPGSPEWNMYHDKIVLDKPEADEAKRPLGDWVMTLRSTVRNFTGRTINGLEIRGAVLDLQRKPIKERTVVVIPTRQPELEPNKTMPVSILIEGMKDSDTRADIQMEVTGFTFK
jgi:hypothetical protein